MDNLKLGYGGTKTEMERLLKDAQKLTGQKYNISKLADVYKAIHAIQENLGITGTTAKEANETISGSISSFKAAWENMLVAVSSGDKDISKASKTLVDTGKTVLSNVVPAIKRSVTGFGSAFKDLAPMIGRELPGLIADIVPGMIEGGWELIKGLGSGLVEAAKNMKWPSWEDVKAGAVALWDAIKAGVAEFGGLVFGKNEKGEVNWPDFSTVVDWAKTNIWDGIIVAGVKKFGGLVFGKDEEGKVNWPSFTEAFKYVKDVLWEKGVKAFVGNLGGLVFGANEKGEVNWPTWEDVVGAATEAWEKIKTEAAKMAGLLFGIKPEDEKALTALGNTIEVIAGAIGTYAVASSIQTAFGSIASLLKIPSANPVLLAISGIAAGAILIAQNWETIYGWIDRATQAVLNFFGIQTQFTDKDIHQANVDDLSKVTENLNNAYTVNQNNVLGMMQEFEGIAQRLNKTRAWDFLTDEQRTAINNKAYSPELMESIYVTLSDALKNEQSALTETTDSMKTLQGQVEALQSSAGTASEALISMANSMPDFSQFMVGDSNAEGSWDVPRDMTARIHKGELIMSAANARQYREGKGSGGSSVDLGGLIAQIGQTVTEAIENANINLDGKRITRSVNRNLAMDMSARRFST